MKKQLLIGLVSAYAGLLFAPPKLVPSTTPSGDTPTLPQSAGLLVPPAQPPDERPLRYSTATLLRLRESGIKFPIPNLPESIKKK